MKAPLVLAWFILEHVDIFPRELALAKHMSACLLYIPSLWYVRFWGIVCCQLSLLLHAKVGRGCGIEP